MSQYPPNQSSWSRARDDTVLAFHTIKLWIVFIAWEAVLMIVPPMMTTVTITAWEFAGIQAVIFLGGMLALLGAVFLVSLLFAPYRQRNELRTKLLAIPGLTPSTLKYPHPPELQISYQKHEFGVFNGEPIITVYAEYRPTGTMRIEAIELQLVGRREPSLDWEVYEVKQDVWITSDNKFKVPDGISPGEHDAKLAAFANGEWWGSDPFTITFPEASS